MRANLLLLGHDLPLPGLSTSPERLRRIVLMASVCLAAIVLIVIGSLLVESRSEAWQRAEAQAKNLTQAIVEDARSQLTLYATMIDIASGFLGGSQFVDMSPDLTSRMLQGMSRDLEVAGVIIVLDKDGNSVVDSAGRSKRTDNFADRAYFAVHRDRPDAGLYVGAPYRSRLRNGDPSIPLSRRVSDPRGNFAGVVVAAIRLEHFRDLFSRFNLGAQSTVSMVNTDGVVVMRQPSTDGQGDVGRDVSRGPLFQHLAAGRTEPFIARGTLDGVERLITFGRVPGLPLVVTVSIATEEILADWWQYATVIGGIALAVCAAIVLLAAALQRKIDELEGARLSLARVAATDGLTGLANRREFDSVIRREWQRAVRDATPLSLLVIDADHFKLVNDRFGHGEGDRVLKEIATVIRSTLMRGGDLAARYGGEEFAAILPNTGETGAMKVAETIRLAVARAGEQARAKGRAGVTVSIGVASITPTTSDTVDQFVRSADAALYQAKDAGRNTSIMAAPRHGQEALLPAPSLSPIPG